MSRSGVVIKQACAAALGLALAALVWTPASAVEDGLVGVRIGSSYRELQERYGVPHGILFGAGGSMLFQRVPGAAPAGLPTLAAEQSATEMPVWVLPVRPGGLAVNQSEWVYDFRENRGWVLGVVLTGEGADAVVTDVIVAGLPRYLRGRGGQVRTERGVTLESSFADVLRRYGYPTLIEIYAPTGQTGAAPAATAGTMRAGAAPGRAGAGGARAGMRGGMGMRGGGPMRGGPMRGGMRGAQGPGLGGPTAVARASGYELVLTQGPGAMRRGGMMRGGMGGRGMAGAGARRGGVGAPGAGRAGALPPLGQVTAAAPADTMTAQAVVNNSAITFSRACRIVYDGIAFTLHDMRVVRIHVSE